MILKIKERLERHLKFFNYQLVNRELSVVKYSRKIASDRSPFKERKREKIKRKKRKEIKEKVRLEIVVIDGT